MDNRHQEKPQGTWLSQFLPNVLIEYWIITHIFTLILSTMKRKIKLSGNFASPTMLQSVAWLSFSVFGGSLKFENWILQSIFNFCFLDKTFQIVDRTTQEGGGGLHSHVNFFPQRPLPREVRFLSCAGRIYLPLPLPLPRNTSPERRRKREIHIYRVVTFPNMIDFSAEYKKDLVITQRKTHSEVSLLLKERFPSTLSLRRECWEIFQLQHCRRSIIAAQFDFPPHFWQD